MIGGVEDYEMVGANIVVGREGEGLGEYHPGWFNWLVCELRRWIELSAGECDMARCLRALFGSVWFLCSFAVRRRSICGSWIQIVPSPGQAPLTRPAKTEDELGGRSVTPSHFPRKRGKPLISPALNYFLPM